MRDAILLTYGLLKIPQRYQIISCETIFNGSRNFETPQIPTETDIPLHFILPDLS